MLYDDYSITFKGARCIIKKGKIVCAAINYPDDGQTLCWHLNNKI